MREHLKSTRAQITRRDEEVPAHHRELDTVKELYTRFTGSEEHTGQVLIVHGPRGVWTDALLKDFKRFVASRREPYFEATCGDSGQTYGPLREILSQYWNHLDDLGLVDPELAAMFEAVAAPLGLGTGLLGSLPQISPDAVVRGQIYLYEQLGALFQAFSERSPAVIAVRDLHLADSTTRAALIFILEHFALDPLQSFAPDEVERGRFRGFLVISSHENEITLQSMRRSLADRANVEFISLSGIDAETVRRFLVRGDVVRRILAASGGNPDNLEALVASLPEHVDVLFERRLSEVDPEARKLLEVLAVYNRPASPDLLVRLLSIPPHAFSPLLTRLSEQHFVTQRVQRGQFLISLASPVLRQLLYDQCDLEWRSELHASIGNLLEERHRLGHPVELEQLAHHFLLSNDEERAIEYALSAAERLHITFAYQRAAEILLAVLDKLRDVTLRRTVLERLVDIHVSLNEFRQALFFCGLLKRETAPAERDEVYRKVAQVLLDMGRYQLALRLLERARGLAQARDQSLELLRIHALRAESFYGQGQLDKASDVCEEHLELPSALESTTEAIRQRVSLSNTQGKIELAREHFLDALSHFERNLSVCEEHNWVEERVRALFNCGVVALWKRDYARAERVFLDCLSYGHNTANPISRAFCLLNLAVVHHKTMRYSKALEYYLHSLATFKKSGSEYHFVGTALNLSELYMALGDHTRAEALLDAAGESLQRRSIHHYRTWRLRLLARLAIERKQYERALEILHEAEGAHSDNQRPSGDREIYVELARVFFHLGKLERYRYYIEAARPEVITPRTAETEVRADWLRASVAHAQGHLDEAVEVLQDVVQQLERSGKLHLLWEVEYHLALVEFDRENFDRGLGWLERAHDLVQTLLLEVPESLRPRFTSREACTQLVHALELAKAGEVPRLTPVPGKTDALNLPQGEAFIEWRKRYQNIVGEHPHLLQIFHRLDCITESDSTVLIYGESGTGKELLAEAIHRNSHRSKGPLIKVNCGAFVETLLLSELFGHEKGAFTGALNRKLGRFELAQGGTLFLDEIGDISPNTQVALLRVLQERTFERVGGSESIHADVRIVCATNRNLEQLVKNGKFRLDLYYRLKAIVLELPALRDRISDIPVLVQHFLEDMAEVDGTPVKRFSREAMLTLLRYSWPGNIRELQNFVRSVALFVPGSLIGPEHLGQFEEFFSDGDMRPNTPETEEVIASYHRASHEPSSPQISVIRLDEHRAQRVSGTTVAALPPAETAVDPEEMMVNLVIDTELGLSELKKKLEQECIKQALIKTQGNITKAASLLKMKRPRLSQIINASPDLQEVKNRLAGS